MLIQICVTDSEKERYLLVLAMFEYLISIVCISWNTLYPNRETGGERRRERERERGVLWVGGCTDETGGKTVLL